LQLPGHRPRSVVLCSLLLQSLWCKIYPFTYLSIWGKIYLSIYAIVYTLTYATRAGFHGTRT
jgi:hypothetical protein